MLATMPILASPLSKEPKLLYIAARRARWWPVEGGSAPTTSSNTSDPDRRRPSGCQIDDDDNTPPPYGNHNIVDLWPPPAFHMWEGQKSEALTFCSRGLPWMGAWRVEGNRDLPGGLNEDRDLLWRWMDWELDEVIPCSQTTRLCLFCYVWNGKEICVVWSL
jgi:hypothetical protein